jgi:hypothetical protein
MTTKKEEFKPPIGNELYEEKRRMLVEQDERRHQARPIPHRQAVAYARTLLDVLETSVRGPSPARIDMTGPPPLANDRIENSPQPEPIGGCFSDLVDEDV